MSKQRPGNDVPPPLPRRRSKASSGRSGEPWKKLVRELSEGEGGGLNVGELPTVPKAKPHPRKKAREDADQRFPREPSPVVDEFDDLEDLPRTVETVAPPPQPDELPAALRPAYAKPPERDDDEYGDAPTVQLPKEAKEARQASEAREPAPLPFETELLTDPRTKDEDFDDAPTLDESSAQINADPTLEEDPSGGEGPHPVFAEGDAQLDDESELPTSPELRGMPAEDDGPTELDRATQPAVVDFGEPGRRPDTTTVPDGVAAEARARLVEPAGVVPAPVQQVHVAHRAEPDDTLQDDDELNWEDTGSVSLVMHPSIQTAEEPADSDPGPPEQTDDADEPVRPAMPAPSWAKAAITRGPTSPKRRGGPPPSTQAAVEVVDPTPPPGRPFGRYQLVRRLKSGGMGEVYQSVTTWGLGVERMVAIKRVLLPLIERDEFVRRFYDEAKIMVQLDHPAIVSLLEFGMVGDEYFMAMEFVHGRDLETLTASLREQALDCPVEVAVYIVMRLLEGLDHAHRAKDKDGKPLNIVHRDVSPPNILCGFDGQVKLTDFGVAQASGNRSLTAPGQLIGKMAYMSPEQIEESSVDRRSDVFAAGIILHELLRGQPLFLDKTELLIMQKVREAPIPSLRRDRPAVSQELEHIVRTALQRDPAHRFAWASDMAKALGRAIASRGKPPEALGQLLIDLYKRAPAGKPL